MIRFAGLAAFAVGLVAPHADLAWKCRERFAESEACVWGKAFLPVSQALSLLILAPLSFGAIVLVARMFRNRDH